MLNSGILIGASNVATALLTLLRNIIVARLIPVEDFGVAATLALTMTMVEMVSYLSLEQFVVQDRDGDRPELIDTVHTLQLARGAFSAILLFAVAQPVARFFGVPDAAWAYQTLALLPFARGLIHLDFFRYQREMRFWPKVLVEVPPYALALAVSYPLAVHFGDYRVMLWVIVIQQVATMLASHLVAEIRYRLGWDRAVVGRAIAFGWPLLLNGILIFAIMQGDRLIVGGLIGLHELGLFSAAFGLIAAGTGLVSNTLTPLFLPDMSRAASDREQFAERYRLSVEISLLAGGAICAFVALFGPWLLIQIYGDKFAAAAGLIVWIGLSMGIRTVRTVWSAAALALGRTKLPFAANLTRAAVLPIVVVSVLAGGGLEAVLFGAILAEAASVVVSIHLFRTRLHLGIGPLAMPLSLFALLLAIVALHEWLFGPVTGLGALFSLGPAAIVAVVLALPLTTTTLRRLALERLFGV